MMLCRFAHSTVYIADEKGDALSSLNHIGEMTPPSDYGMVAVKMFLTLFALALLLGGTFWLLRRLIQQRIQKSNHDSSIQILEKRVLSPKTLLYLVEVEGKKILLAESHLEIKQVASLEKEPDSSSQ